MMQMRKEKEDAMRKKIDEDALRDLRPTPSINKKSQSLNRSVNDMFEWEQSRKDKLERRVFEIQQEEDAAITGIPVVTKTADRIARKLRESNSTSGEQFSGNVVEVRLLQYDEKKKLKLQRMIEHQSNEIKRKASTSHIAPHSASLPRSGDVADRLYNIASVQQREREELVEAASLRPSYDESTGQRLFQVSD